MNVTLPEREYGAYIFDLDGTLVDSMPQHYEAWKKALTEVRLPIFDEDTYYSMGGRSASDIVAQMAAEQGRSDIDPDEVAVLKRKHYFMILATDPPKVIAKVAEFAKEKKQRDIPLAIATGSALPGALATLKAAGLDGMFDIIVTPDDVINGKPAPDMFLLAAEKMGVAPESCCVFEDAEPGIKGALDAGMSYVRVYSRDK